MCKIATLFDDCFTKGAHTSAFSLTQIVCSTSVSEISKCRLHETKGSSRLELKVKQIQQNAAGVFSFKCLRAFGEVGVGLQRGNKEQVPVQYGSL